MLLKSVDHPSSVVKSSTRRRTKAGVMGRRRVDLACSFDARRSAKRGMAGLGIVGVVGAGSVRNSQVVLAAWVGWSRQRRWGGRRAVKRSEGRRM
ncbi:hypothetical protein BU14_2859s0001 [Porphyra umbilicalis]|uniref:Uncharacterized protein n=1 Tax=Porphyra umbilicalis TaxID=2786 RepID=A0A1X6NIG1_PORUM|nr:hypothetical protein BU14_2859s0001 [Porphyra umbilicalis]|eukprot:OSX68404.1 hypothetical protein BU14_2859s0001 [Porphyra umbilicalis]